MRARAGVLGLALAALSGPGCGEKAQTPPAPPPPESAPAGPLSVNITSGRVDFEALRGRMERVPAVYVVSEIDEATRQALDEQLAHFKAREAALQSIHGVEHAKLVTGADLDYARSLRLLDATARERLAARLTAWRAALPEPVTVELEAGANSGRTARFTTSPALIERYRDAVRQLRFTTLAEDTRTIRALVEADRERLRAAADAEDPFTRGEAAADLRWLSAFTQYYQELSVIAGELEAAIGDAAREARARVLQARREQGGPLEAWERYKQQEAPALEMHVMKNLEGMAYTGQEGRFRALGHGPLILSLELDGETLWVPAGSDALPLSVRDLQRGTLVPCNL